MANSGWSNDSINTLVIPTGATTGARVIIANQATGDAIDIYDSANRLVFSIDGEGIASSFSYGPDLVAQMFEGALVLGAPGGGQGALEWEESPGPTSGSDIVLIVNPTGGGAALNVFFQGGSPDGTSTTSGIVVNTRGIFGSMIQSDQIRTNELVHTGTYSGVVAGGDGHWIFDHGCAFTPKVAMLTPWDAASSDQVYQFMLWNVPFPNATQVRTVTRTAAGGVVANGTTVGVHATFWG
jgi:hypothetical protein